MAEVKISARTKGLPFVEQDVSIDEIARQRWSLLSEDLPLPVAVLRRDVLANNSRWMREFITRTGVK